MRIIDISDGNWERLFEAIDEEHEAKVYQNLPDLSDGKLMCSNCYKRSATDEVIFKETKEVMPTCDHCLQEHLKVGWIIKVNGEYYDKDTYK